MAIDSEKIAAVKTAMDNTYEKRVNKKTTISGSYTGDTDSYPTILACINKFGELVTSWNVTPSNAHYPSEKLVKDTLENYIQKSQTAGLVKNDGTIDTNTYLTEHQDISGKANSADLATVATSGSYNDLSNQPSIPSSTSDLSDGASLIKTSSTTGLVKNDGSIFITDDWYYKLDEFILALIEEGNPVLPPATFVINGSQFTSYSDSPFTYDGEVTIDWGDGTTETYNGGTLSHTYTESGEYRINLDGNITSFNENCFRDNSVLTEVNVPDTVTSLGKWSFLSNGNLTKITFPVGVTSLPMSVCSSCPNLTDVTLPNGLTSLSDYCFSNCGSLTEIDIPISVTSFGNYTFRSDANLERVILHWDGSHIQYYNAWWYNGSDKVTFSIPPNTKVNYKAWGYPEDKLIEREE